MESMDNLWALGMCALSGFGSARAARRSVTIFWVFRGREPSEQLFTVCGRRINIPATGLVPNVGVPQVTSVEGRFGRNNSVCLVHRYMFRHSFTCSIIPPEASILIVSRDQSREVISATNSRCPSRKACRILLGTHKSIFLTD